MNIKQEIKFCIISSAKIAKYIRLKYLPIKICTLTVLLKSSLSRFTSLVKIVFKWNIVLSSQCQIFINKFSEIEFTKKDVNFFVVFFLFFCFWRFIWYLRLSLKLFMKYWLIGKRLRSRERGFGESSGFSHPLGKGGKWGIGGGGDSFSRLKSPSFRHFLLHKVANLHNKNW